MYSFSREERSASVQCAREKSSNDAGTVAKLAKRGAAPMLCKEISNNRQRYRCMRLKILAVVIHKSSSLLK